VTPCTIHGDTLAPVTVPTAAVAAADVLSWPMRLHCTRHQPHEDDVAQVDVHVHGV
jgi:hypothetical protein